MQLSDFMGCVARLLATLAMCQSAAVCEAEVVVLGAAVGMKAVAQSAGRSHESRGAAQIRKIR